MRQELAAIDLNQIKDPFARQGMVLLMNLVEELSAENQHLRAENQELRDEIKRLKGEQGQPKIKPEKKDTGEGKGKGKGEAPAHASEKERR